MITIISGTNRKDSKSDVVAKEYSRYLTEMGEENQILSMTDLPLDIIQEDMYSNHQHGIKKLYNKYIEPVDKFVFIIPEYNGGFPGVLKVFIDCVPPSMFYGKKAGLVGVSAGRAGNLRGTDQFTNVLNYLQVNVFHLKPPLSLIDTLVDDKGTITDEVTEKILREHAKSIVAF